MKNKQTSLVKRVGEVKVGCHNNKVGEIDTGTLYEYVREN